MSAVLRGETFVWASILPAPEGYALIVSTNVRFAILLPAGIVALRDHEHRPRLPEDFMDRLDAIEERRAAQAATHEELNQ